MKNSTIPYILGVIIAILSHNSLAITIYSRNGGGLWTNGTTWSLTDGGGPCSCTPVAGDNITIRSGELVYLSSSPTISGAPMNIRVLGTWRFDNPAKLTIPSGSVVTIEIGGLLDNNGGNGHNNYLTIGTWEAWYAQLGDIHGYKVYSDVPLPVELLYFNVKYDQSKVLINWATSQELNNKSFEVEKSYDGNSFHTIKQVHGHNNSSSINTYLIDDTDLKSKIIYYRLKQIDQNGNSEVFKIKSVVVNNLENKIIVYPNPSQSNEILSVTLPDIDTNEETVIQIINSFGQVIYTRVCTNYDSGNNFILTPDTLSGNYILKASNNQRVYQQKIHFE